MGGLESTGGVRLHNHRRKLKQRFDIVRKLGQGTYGKVQMGINKETGQEVAIKTIKKCKIETEADLIRIRREIQIMSSVQHPNIIHIYEVFENREKMVLVMEYAAGGELYDFLSERKVLSEEEARRIFRQIATAVYYCHKHKICHRDLKLENILLDENGNAKIADFGLSNVFDECRLLSTFCGSPLYASPEIVKGTPYHGPEVDCWSLGVLLYTLVYGAMPFDGSNFKRLVRQISQGDYFEPKKPSPASPLIRDMLNVNPSRRADITAICSHWWVDTNQSEPCLEIAEELANQTPVRLDLLLSLAPNGSSDKLLVDQVNLPGQPGVTDRPLRSQSLGSLASTTASAQPIDFILEKRDVDTSKKKADDTVNGVKKKEKSKSKRERSSSRSRRDDSTPEPDSGTEKPKRRSVKASKKKSNDTVVLEETKEEDEIKAKEDTVIEEDLSKPQEKIQDSKAQEKIQDSSVPTSNEAVNDKAPSSSEDVITVEKPKEIINKKLEEKKGEEAKETVSKPVERRKSKIFETAEKFNNIAEPAKSVQKKVIIPGVKVSDAKKAYERRSSLASSGSIARGSPSRKSVSGESNLTTPETEDKFSLASSVNLNKLVESVEKMAEMEDKQSIKALDGDTNNNVSIVNERETEEKVKSIETTGEPIIEDNKNEEELADVESNKKVKSAAQVISSVLNDVGAADSKAATLPRRRTSRAEIKLTMPSRVPEYKSEVEHVVGNPSAVQRSEVIFPVAAPSTVKPATPVTPYTKSVKRQESYPREHIIPIQMEEEAPKSQPAIQQEHRTSTASLSRQSTQDSETGSVTSQGEPIRKSPREVIIPIAVEGGGYVTPSADTLTRMGSLNESEDDLPRGFGLHSTRRHNRQLETADSISSDEDDDNFEILTAENLFSTLLSRVRSLTQRLNVDEGRPAGFPRLFNHHSIFDTPASRRLSEARSFTRGEASPWRRSISRDSSTLPRAAGIRVTMHAPTQTFTEDTQ